MLHIYLSFSLTKSFRLSAGVESSFELFDQQAEAGNVKR